MNIISSEPIRHTTHGKKILDTAGRAALCSDATLKKLVAAQKQWALFHEQLLSVTPTAVQENFAKVANEYQRDPSPANFERIKNLRENAEAIAIETSRARDHVHAALRAFEERTVLPLCKPIIDAAADVIEAHAAQIEEVERKHADGAEVPHEPSETLRALHLKVQQLRGRVSGITAGTESGSSPANVLRGLVEIPE